MTKQQIYYNYIGARKKAEELERIAENLKRQSAQRLGNTATALSTSWSGEASRMFLSKNAQLQDEYKRTADSLISIAATIRRIADRTYKTEMRALEIAQQRKYKQ